MDTPTHKIEVKKGNETKYLHITEKDMKRIVRDLNDSKKSHILINSNFYPRYSVGITKPLTETELQSLGERKLWYTDKALVGTHEGEAVWRFQRREETLRRKSEGGSTERVLETKYRVLRNGEFVTIDYK